MIPRVSQVADRLAKVVLVKERLMPEVDATGTGGYRDMLINCRVKSTGHVVEIQITLRDLLRIKNSGGYTEYKLARALDLNEKSTYTYVGNLTDSLMTGIKCGLIREIECRDSQPVEMYTKLAHALSQPGCLVRKLELAQVL